MFPLKDTIPSRTFPLVTIAIIMFNSLIFLYELSLGPQLTQFIQTFGLVPQRYFLLAQNDPGNIVGRFFPIFSSMFLHGGWLHIIGNMWFLWIFGDNVEDSMGHGRFFLFYLLSGLAAAYTQLLFNPASQVPTIGASGAIAGVMGAYFLLFPRAKIITLIIIIIFIDIIEIPAYFFLGFWLLLQFMNGVATLTFTQQTGGVAWWAHLGGFVAGAVLVFLFRKSPRQTAKVYHDRYFPW